MTTVTTTSSLALVPSLETAWQDVDSSFERFCLTAGIGAIEQMLCDDAQQLAGAPHNRGGSRIGHRWGRTKGKSGFHGGKVAVHRPRVRSYDGHEVALPTWTAELRLQLINPSTSPNELNTTLTPHNIIHSDACFAYFNKIWGTPLVPSKDPTYDEIQIANEARIYGVSSTNEMRKRQLEYYRCGAELVATTGDPFADIVGASECDALLWGLSERVYEERFQTAKKTCALSDEEKNRLKSMKRTERRDHPISLKRVSCMISTILGR